MTRTWRPTMDGCIRDGNDAVIAEEVASDDARLICRAVNVHGDLVDDLSFLMKAAQGVIDAGGGFTIERAKLIAGIELARAALAKAGEASE